MSLSNLKQSAEVKDSGDKDVLGRSFILDSGVYPFTIDLAYLQQSKGGATSVNLHLISDSNQELRQTIYVTNKEGKTYYVDRQTSEKKNLPGFSQINAMVKLITGKELHELSTEQKTIKLYDADAKKELPTVVEVISELSNQKIIAGVLKCIVDKTTKQGNEYVPTGETKEVNEIDKFFRFPDGMTNSEIQAGATEGTFLKAWKEKNGGQVRNKATKDAKAPAAPGTSGSSPKPATSLFSNQPQ